MLILFRFSLGLVVLLAVILMTSPGRPANAVGFLHILVTPQANSISGHVTDDRNNPLPDL
jgi:hypothetical protein